jgi:hypothetical protein
MGRVCPVITSLAMALETSTPIGYVQPYLPPPFEEATP